ncbi:MAG: hypothetical protein HETSPECPRED_010502 [Heterodermia speciosa]|uniref:Enoyl reductase (ER) domain-containing protein n=1 Tax=Heterodermia speciosa TaxID=116794 RepID=A0A8H3G541_9LECA|nr:MAG: hypothetical protein HETSPECPRED_010502 [Heterodermia speciosa]
MSTMNAVVFTEFGGPDVLFHKTVPKPSPTPGFALIKVQAFGINHAELHMRRGEWNLYNPISGLECVGIVESCPSRQYLEGKVVAGLMGGIGLIRPGSYGEYVNVPVSNVVRLETSLPWEQLAAIPETYCTAWSCLFTLLDLKASERLLIRGATSTIGQAAVHLAVDAGAYVTATTRQAHRFENLRQIGAQEVWIEEKGLDKKHNVEPMTAAWAVDTGDGKEPRFDKTLNLIGNRVLLESISLTRPGGRITQAGWLGGLDPVVDFNPMLQMDPGVHFSLFHSKVLGTKEFPLKAIPLQEIVRKVEQGKWDAKPARVFEYQNIRDAHRLADEGTIGGKIVVKH